jgi:hypothetical protein
VPWYKTFKNADLGIRQAIQISVTNKPELWPEPFAFGVFADFSDLGEIV